MCVVYVEHESKTVCCNIWVCKFRKEMPCLYQ